MPKERQHVTTGVDCWCGPRIEAYGTEERMSEETFVHEITISARHRTPGGDETFESVFAELSHDKADPRRAADHVLHAAQAMIGGDLREIDRDA
jgi:hypothetical protein